MRHAVRSGTRLSLAASLLFVAVPHSYGAPASFVHIAPSTRPSSDSRVDHVDILLEYLSLRWVVVPERVALIVCGEAASQLDDRAMVRLRTEGSRVLDAVIRVPDCKDKGEHEVQAALPVIRVSSIAVDPADTTRGVLKAKTDTRRNYYLLEIMRFNRTTGAGLALEFSGFEEYIPPWPTEWQPSSPTPRPMKPDQGPSP